MLDFNMGMGVVMRPIAQFLYQFTGATTTLPDGTRKLVDSGTAEINGTLFSGHRLKFDGTQNIVLPYEPPLNEPRTFIADFEYINADNYIGSLISTSSPRHYFGLIANNRCIVAFDSSHVISLPELNLGQYYRLGVVQDGVGNAHLYFNGEKITTVAVGNRLAGQNWNIGGRGTSYLNTGGKANFMDIPCALTDEEMTKDYLNPEFTLYKEDNTLKSDLSSINQTVLTDMQAGNGVWFPLTENNNCKGYVRNHAFSGYSDDSTRFKPTNSNDATFRANFTAGDVSINGQTLASGTSTTIANADEYVILDNAGDTLTRFYCQSNSLTGSIPDLSSNVALGEFYCHSNKLTGSIPDLSNNVALTRFYCYSNNLTGSIPDLSNNVALTRFYCYSNNLTGSIPDLSSNVALMIFRCEFNKLTGSIPDLSNNVALINFYCDSNSLTGSIPDLSSNVPLERFHCRFNSLTGSIPDLSNNVALRVFNCQSNSLTSHDGGAIVVSHEFKASNNALTQSAVDSILAGLVSGGTNNATITLDGGSNAAPSSTGEGNVDVLRFNGCTVTVAGGY